MYFPIRAVRDTRDELGWSDQLCMVHRLNTRLFPADKPVDVRRCTCWLAWDEELPIAFLCAMLVGPRMRIERYGTLPAYRGWGLGLRLLRTCTTAARMRGCSKVITYTLPCNSKSMNTLIRAGYRTYQPKRPYMQGKVVYWFHPLK